MRTSNIVVMTIAAVVSIALLWLWFYLGFNHIDSPFDLVLSIIWWAVIAAAIVWIRHVEKQRQEQRRTMYVSAQYVYNPETGVRAVDAEKPTVQVAQGILEDMQYGFQIKEAPKNCEQAITHIIRSKTFKVQQADGQAENAQVKEVVEWTGEVALAGRSDIPAKVFSSKEELAVLLEQAAA